MDIYFSSPPDSPELLSHDIIIKVYFTFTLLNKKKQLAPE